MTGAADIILTCLKRFLLIILLVLTFFRNLIFDMLVDSKNMTIRFTRRTDVMPPAPVETKFHPSAVDLLLIKRLITETTKLNLIQFLQHEFTNIGKAYAERLIGMMESRESASEVDVHTRHFHLLTAIYFSRRDGS